MNRTRFAATLLLALLPLAAAPLLAADKLPLVPTAEELQHLIVRDVQAGSGPGAEVGNMLQVQYTGWLYDAYAPDLHGKQFDSSVGHEPFTLMLGVGSVIPGWDRGLQGMQVGGKRTLIIPANLAYGERGMGQDIPPGAILVFDIELLKMR